MKFKHLCAAVALSSITVSAQAAFIKSSGEADLNEIINGTMIVDGAPVSALGDTATNDAITSGYFRNSPDAQNSSATFLIEITAGYTDQTFGLFNDNDYVQLFGPDDTGSFTTDGTDGQKFKGSVEDSGTRARVSFEVNAGYYDVYVSDQHRGTFASDEFGFYLGKNDGGAPLYYSDASKNPGESERFVAFQGKNQSVNLGSKITYGCDSDNPSKCVTWGNDDYVVGFEDGTDDDFNDLMVYVQDVVPVPEPGTLALLGLGLAGLGVSRRRKQA